MFSKRQCTVKNYTKRPYVRRYVYVSQVPRQRRCHIAARRLFRSKYDELRFSELRLSVLHPIHDFSLSIHSFMEFNFAARSSLPSAVQ